ncbi:MAG: hypothetical protein RQ824_12585 [bacterium]|nr:hypothetical protein [bacterium]
MEEQSKLTKLEALISTKGKLVRTVSHDLEATHSETNVLSAQVMVVDTGDSVDYFLLLSKEREDDEVVAAIAEDDFKAITGAIASLKAASLVDVYLNADHVQNIFATDDNFTIGYFVLDSSLTWFIALDEDSDELEYFDDLSVIENLLTSAQEKIKEIKKVK